MKRLPSLCLSLLTLLLCAATANAWHVRGQVRCPDGAAFDGVVITVTGSTCVGVFTDVATTSLGGLYIISLPDCPATYTLTLDPNTLPPGGTVADTSVTFVVTEDQTSQVIDWEVSGTPCEQAGKCWFTGGGAKIDPLIGLPVAQKGKWISFGGNVNPGCSPTAGDGGNWNHIDRLANLHFQGRTIQVLSCGNVTPPPPPGSTSPVTPFNFIEWTGVGTIKGIQGNKVGTIPVYFNARTEDRNEPGSKDSNAGSGIDRYYLHVYSDPADPAGSTLLLVNGDANPLNVVPVEIDHGNFQLHISSCDNPPTP